MRTLVAVALAFILSAVPAWGAAPVGTGKVFSSGEGERVSVIPLLPLESHKALLYIEGTGGELDGKVLPHEVSEQRDETYYSTDLRGRGYSTLVMRTSRGRKSHLLHVPGRRNAIEVTYDEARSGALKPETLYALHQKQAADGTLKKLMAFDRKAEVAGEAEDFAKTAREMNEACGTSVEAAVAWEGISDELLKKYSIASYCGEPLSALRRLCRSEGAKKALQAQVKRFECRWGETPKLERAEGRVSWTTGSEAVNVEKMATEYFQSELASPEGGGETLAQWLTWEKTVVCADGRGHYVVVAPHERQTVELSYGDGQRFVKVPAPPWGLSGYDFLEPRFVDDSRNSSFRGLDMRIYSEVKVDEEKQACAVRCGKKTSDLSWVEASKARELLRKATFEPNPRKYVPYQLLRDTKGRYYQVDRGFHPEDENRFRVWLGLKGSMQEQKMVDLVSDSEGQIFSTKKGELRLVVDKHAPSTWIEGSKKLELRSVPVEENLPLIYNELGVYTGERLGTPCDDQ